MSISVLHFDVFTTTPGKGSPAGIVLDADGMSDGEMQALATRTGFPDIAARAPSGAPASWDVTVIDGDGGGNYTVSHDCGVKLPASATGCE